MHGKFQRWAVALVVCLALIAVTSPIAQAAETVHAFLKLGGNPIVGESTQVSLGRADSIECLAFRQVFDSTGRVSIKITKRIDAATTTLIKAYLEKSALSGEFKFFRPNPTGDGTTQQYFTIRVDGARIVGYEIINPSTITPESANDPGYEEITFTCESVTWEIPWLKMMISNRKVTKG